MGLRREDVVLVDSRIGNSPAISPEAQLRLSTALLIAS
jgi:hypothetical protein